MNDNPPGVPRFTSIRGQFMLPYLWRLKNEIEGAKSFDPDFDIVKANKWLRDSKRAGTWKYKPPKRRRRTAVKSKKKAFSHKERRDAQIAAMNKRRQDAIDAKKNREDELRRMVSVKQTNACSWQYTDHRSGRTYYCTNGKEQHPLLPGEEGRFCRYHTKLCIIDHSGQGADSRKFKQIENPNRFALCDDCWHGRLTGFPRKLDPLRLPGVYPIREENYRRLVNVQAATTATASTSAEDEVEPLCRFRKTNPATMRPMFCSAPRIRHRITKGILFECGWHQKVCIGSHTGKSPTIEIPNELGVCVAHYVSITGSKPSIVVTHWTQVPTVGYKRTLLRIAPRRDSLAPRGKPPWKKSITKPIDDNFVPFGEDEISFKKFIADSFKKFSHFIWLNAPSPPMPVIRAKWAVQLFLHKHRLRKAYKVKAVVIQRSFRAFLGRNRARLAKERRIRERREWAACVIQRLCRAYLGNYHATNYLNERELAAAKINKVVRGMLTRRRLKRHFAAILFQKNLRGFLARVSAGGKKLLRTLENEAIDRVWAASVLYTASRRWLARRHRTYWYLPDTSQEDASRILQRNIRGWIGRRKARDQAVWIQKYYKAIAWFQRWTRGYLARKYFSSDVMPRLLAAQLFQRLWRGMKDRRDKVAPARAELRQAWDWLNPTLPTDAFEQFLPRSAYDVPGGGRPVTISRSQLGSRNTPEVQSLVKYLAMCQDGINGVEAVQGPIKQKKKYELLSGTQKKEARQKKREAIARWPRGPFAIFDPEKSGVISKKQFREAVHACGHYISPNQQVALEQRFDPSQVGWVNYENFLLYARAQQRPCTKHRSWGCALCVSQKHCLKCDCKRFKQEPSGGYLGYSEICECGHYSTMHILAPLKNEDKQYVPGEGYTKKQLTIMLNYEGEKNFPANIPGSFLPRTHFQTAYTFKDLKATLNNVDNRIAGTMNVFPVEKTRQSDHQASVAYAGLFEHVISKIAETSKNVVNDLDGENAWNSCTQPRATKMGRAVPSEVGSGKLSSVGDVQAAPKMSKAAEEKLAEIKRKEKEVEVALRSDPRSTTKGIRDQLAAAKDESQDLLVSVASNVSNLEIYETKFTLTRPLPLIGDKSLRMRVDTEAMFIEVLIAFGDETMGLLEDDNLFAQYVYNIFTFMDRHWKKVCSSLRMGTIHHSIEIDRRTKALIESQLTPQPERSELLDAKLKELGFHRRASNAKFNETFLEKKKKDDKPVPVSKEPTKRVDVPRPSTSAYTSRGGLKLHREMSTPASLASLGLVSFKDSFGRSTDSAKNTSRPQSGQRPNSVQLHKRDNMQAELLPDLNVQFHKTTIDERFYDISTGPLRREIKVLTEPRMTKPFVCDHPGCGKSFTDPRVARLHQKEHSGKIRLQAKSHAADQRLEAHWPKDIPWKSANFTQEQLKMGIDKDAIGKRYVSRITGKRFLQKKELIAHLRFQERYRSKLEDIPEDKNIFCLGEEVHVPPRRIPEKTPIETCEKHFIGTPMRCKRCEEVSRIVQPGLPCTFYQHIRVNYELTSVPFKVQNYGRLMMVKTEIGNETPVSIAAICKDSHKRVWIAYSKFWKSKSLKKLNYHIRSDFWPKYELVEEKEIKWMHLTEITGTCFVLSMSRSEFNRQKREKMLPKAKNVFFCKEIFSAKKAKETYDIAQALKLVDEKEKRNVLKLAKLEADAQAVKEKMDKVKT